MINGRHEYKTTAFSFVEACLNLFKAVPNFKIDDPLPMFIKASLIDSEERNKIKKSLEKKYTLNKSKLVYIGRYNLHRIYNVASGFFITEKAFQACPCVAGETLTRFFESTFGEDVWEARKKFFKSDDGRIFLDKIQSYMEDYVRKNSDTAYKSPLYIPNEALGLSAEAKPVKITIIDAIDRAEVEARVRKMLKTFPEFSEETAEDILTIIDFLNIKLNLDEVLSKSLEVKLFQRYDILPDDPVEFLRYMIFITSGATEFPKDESEIENIRRPHGKFIRTVAEYYFSQYIEKNGLDKLVNIFRRFKPLWLALASYSEPFKSAIKKIRKLSSQYYKTFTPQLLERLTPAENINLGELKAELAKITTFKKISLVNDLICRNAALEIIDVIINSIAADIQPKVQGKKIYIPANFNYAAPDSDKNFICGVPEGSSYTMGESCVVGVERIYDPFVEYLRYINFSLDYTSSQFNSRIIPDFGEKTLTIDAGAEASIWLSSRNYSTVENSTFKLFISDEETNETLYLLIRGLKNKKMLGYVSTTEGKSKIYFGTNLIKSGLSLNEILTRAGAILAGVTAADCDINLDPVETSRYTFLDLFMKNN